MASSDDFDIQDGYRGLAGYMEQHLHSGMGVSKRFSKLNTLDLFYMQAELMNLKQESKVLAYIDHANPASYTFAKRVRDMKTASSSMQWQKVLEIRNLLKAYSKAPFPRIWKAKISVLLMLIRQGTPIAG
jgi:hypothetical protein